MRRFVAAGLLWSVFLLSAPSAVAQDAEAARAAFGEGEQHYADERWLLAAGAFQRAYDLMEGAPTQPLILFNIASALDHVPGRECEARDAYQSFLLNANGDEPEVQERIRTIQDRMRELDARVEAQGASCDGTPDGDEPGSTSTAETVSPVGPIVLGIGGASLLAGAITGALALVADSNLAELCSPGMACPESARSSADEVQSLALATDVLLVTGGVVAAVGLVLTLLLRDEVPVEASAACTSSGCGAMLQGAF